MSLSCCQQVLSTSTRTRHPQREVTSPPFHQGRKFSYLNHLPTRRTDWSSRVEAAVLKKEFMMLATAQTWLLLHAAQMLFSFLNSGRNSTQVYFLFVCFLSGFFFCGPESKVKFLLHVDNLKLNLCSWKEHCL